jgi:hypothetical protein
VDLDLLVLDMSRACTRTGQKRENRQGAIALFIVNHFMRCNIVVALLLDLIVALKVDQIYLVAPVNEDEIYFGSSVASGIHLVNSYGTIGVRQSAGWTMH